MMTGNDGKMGADWPGPGHLGAAGSGRPTAHDIATRMLAFSQARILAFAPHGMVINDIAWDLLLRLFVAHERGRRMSVQKLCDDVSLPGVVTLRWVRALRAAGLVHYDDAGEGLAAQARLTPTADGVLRGLIGQGRGLQRSVAGGETLWAFPIV